MKDFEREVLGRVPVNVPKVTWAVTETFKGMLGPYPIMGKQYLPVDAHELIALRAPRLTFSSYGVPEKGDSKWLDQQGGYMATVAAGPVFRLLGAKDLGTSDDYRPEKCRRSTWACLAAGSPGASMTADTPMVRTGSSSFRGLTSSSSTRRQSPRLRPRKFNNIARRLRS